MKSKIITAREATKRIKDGDFVMIGGFLRCGYPRLLVEAMRRFSDARGLTILSNDTCLTEENMTPIIASGRVRHIIASYIGLNQETIRQHFLGNVSLFPQGSLAEKIRSGGAGIPAFLTPTGVGTLAEEGKTKMTLNGREYLLEETFRGDVGLVRATVADKSGNLFMRGTTKNFNALIPAACAYVVAEAEKIVETGELDPELITVPGILVDAIVKAGEDIG